MEYKLTEVGRIPRHWEVVSLGEIGQVIGGGTPSTKKEEYYNGEIPWITPKDLSGYTKKYINKGSRNITEMGLKYSSAKMLPRNTVLLSSRAPIGYVAIAGQELTTNQGFKSIICNEERIIPEYLYYVLKSSKEALESISSGSTFKEVSGSTVKSFKIGLPSIEEQRRINDILSSLDDKIELNEELIENLEEISQTLFKHWFLDFEFPNGNREPYLSSGGDMIDSNIGKIPRNWDVKSLIEIMDYQGGSQPPASEFIDMEKEGYIRLIQIRDYDTEKHLTYIPDTKKLKKCTKFDIMIARYGAALGRILFGLTGSYNVALAKVIPNAPHYREFLRNYLKSSDFYERINGMGERSAQAGFNKSDIKSFKVAFPANESILIEFNTIASQIIEMILSKREENQELIKLKNALIPKLLSGEIELFDENEVTEHVPVP